jgi:dihydroorotate dehydrogenase (fumarate)
VVANHELSRPSDARQALRWIGVLRPQLGPDVSLAATSGVWSGTDALKLIAVGADVAMTTSALLHHGPAYLATMAAELQAWLIEHEYESVRQLCGSASAASVADPSAFERANYMRNLRSWSSPPVLES